MSQDKAIFLHENLSAICLSGDQPAAFLNDLLTAQIMQLDEVIARSACLLSPQGRVLFDMMVVKKGEHIYLITENDQTDPLIKRLSLYRLRRKIDIRHETGLMVCHSMDQNVVPSASKAPLIRADERHNDLGFLCLVPSRSEQMFQSDVSWHCRRIALGIPQGAADLTPNRALMLEAGLHLLGGVDFKKGCYIGQEVTARTHYRGLVKRRLFPVSAPITAFQTGKMDIGAEIFIADKAVGTCKSSAPIDNNNAICLASLRLDAVAGLNEGLSGLSLEDGTPVHLNIPEWMHPLPGFDPEEE